MSQTVVTSYYASKKRFKDPGKSVKLLENEKFSDSLVKEDIKSSSKSLQLPKSRARATTKTQIIHASENGKLSETFTKEETKPTTKCVKLPKPKVTKTSTKVNKSKSKQNKVTSYLETQPAKSQQNTTNKKDVEALEKTITAEFSQDKKQELPRTPKRNLSNPDESTPTKKRVLKDDGLTPCSSTKADLDATFTVSPAKADTSARRKLMLNSPTTSRFASPRKIASPVKSIISPQKAASYGKLNDQELAGIVNESRSKILFSNRLDELKESLEKFSKMSSKVKDFQSSSCKITSVISSAKKNDSQPKLIQVAKPAYQKYSYLAASVETLVLPYHYRLLEEIFKCTDVIISMLHNRKEKITFQKLQSGVQKMMNKNFHKSHLGQLMTVFPEAYSLQYEKNNSCFINKNGSVYDLVITPKLQDMSGDSMPSKEPSTEQKTTNSFIQMTPLLLLERKKQFYQNLLKIAKQHHREFLTSIHFTSVNDDAIVRWHPEFKVDSVPDVPIAALPEEPESKIHSAKDILNKIKGSVKGRVVKALQSVADEHKQESIAPDSPITKPKLNKKQSSALKGICTDLLEKIRARESAKLVDTMTRSVQDEKRNAMIEKLPKIIHIIWHYFIAERKAAVTVDAMIEKIVHSCGSLYTSEAVKEHLQLITEVLPGWLSFIKIPKGEYITMNKTKDINEMIASLKR